MCMDRADSLLLDCREAEFVMYRCHRGLGQIGVLQPASVLVEMVLRYDTLMFPRNTDTPSR
jgi:hypothetical protein